MFMTALLTVIESSGMWEAVSKITNPVTLVAFALAALVVVMQAWLRSKRKSIPNAFWVAVIALVLVGVAAALYQKPSGEIYRVRITVIDPQGIPVDDAKVWSSFGGEPKRVAGGWQFDIPTASRPQNGKLSFFASKESAFLTGRTDLTLRDDYNPAVTVSLRHNDAAKVRGQVVDGTNHAIVGARVFVVGYESEALITKEGGNFELPAHAALNQQILLHAEKSGYPAVKLWHPAGDAPAVLSLKK
jgi:amino acid transporter